MQMLPPLEIPEVDKVLVLHHVQRRHRSRERSRVRSQVLIRDNMTCQSCQRVFYLKYLTLGHVIPFCYGGMSNQANLRTQCKACNERMGPEVWMSEIYRYADSVMDLLAPIGLENCVVKPLALRKEQQWQRQLV